METSHNLTQPNGCSCLLPSGPGNIAVGQILVTKGNPSRGKGFEISHFIRRNGTVKSISRLDLFLPSMRKAITWVCRRYPGATLVSRRKDHFGRLAALCFECSVRELLPAKGGPKAQRAGGSRLADASKPSEAADFRN